MDIYDNARAQDVIDDTVRPPIPISPDVLIPPYRPHPLSIAIPAFSIFPLSPFTL